MACTGSEFTEDGSYKPSKYSPFYKKPGPVPPFGNGIICAGRGCIRACMVGLEARGVLKNKFKTPFRTEKPWLVDWSDYDTGNKQT